MSNELTQQVLVRMPADLHQALKAKAAADERSMAQAIRFAIRLYLEQPPNAWAYHPPQPITSEERIAEAWEASTAEHEAHMEALYGKPEDRET